MAHQDRLGSLSHVKEDQGSHKRDEGGGGDKNSNVGYIQRCVIIQRDDKGYGLTVRGDNPVYVESVKADGAAARAGVQQGDRIVKVNGTLVTNSNHIDVVKLIKSGSFVALTLLNKPPTGGGPIPAGDQTPGGATRRVTAPLPVDASKSRELVDSKYRELKRYYDLAFDDLQQSKKEYSKNPSAKLGALITDKEKTVKKLEEQLKGHHTESVPDFAQYDPQQPGTASWPVTTLDGGNTSESPTLSPSSSPTPTHPRNITVQSEDNDSVSSGTTKDSGYEESNPVSIGGRAQQDIIAMEDDEFSDEDTTVDNGAFSNLTLLENKPSHLAVFLNYIFQMNHDPSSLLFYIISGYYQSAPGTCKELKKWAFEIYSTFLVVDGSPLRVRIDEGICVEIDNILAYRNDKEDVLRNIFSNARYHIQSDLQVMLAEFCNKKEIGFASMFGAHDLRDNMKKNEEIQVVEKYILPQLDRCLNKGDSEESVKTERDLAIVWALNTFLRNVGVTKHNPSMDRVQSFIAKDKRLLKLGVQKKKSVQNHQFQLQHYYKVEKCLHCGKVIWGVGYQAYQCQTCELNVHKTCIDDLDEPCKKKRVKSKFGIGRPTSTAYPLKEPDKESPSPSPNANTIFNIEPARDDEKGTDHSVNSLVKNFEDLQGDRRRSPGIETTEQHKYVIGKNPRRKKGSDLGRSESMKSRGDSKGDRPTRRAKSDVDMDENLTRVVMNSGSSSTSSLRSAESPSTSVEAVNNIPQSVDNDSDFEVEAELPPLKEVLSEEVYKKLKPKERKRQEVINELFYTEKTHVKNLKILEMLFYKPMVNDNVNDNLTKALFPNIGDILALHTSLNDEMKKKRKENPVVGEVAEILVKRFDGEEGEAFRNGCAIYCRNQSHALETLRSRQKKDSRLSNFLSAAESSNLMRRLQLKDLIPTQMMRLTKYPLLIENLMKYTSANSEEHAKLERALQCSKHILEYVNQAVKEYENHYKLEHLQRKVEKKLDGVPTPEDSRLIKELDLTKHKLVHDGNLTWNINQRKAVDVHVVLLEDVLVLLQKQDEKLVLKFQSTQLVAGKDDSKYMFSPLLDLSSVLAANSKATDKKAFFVVAKSQIYELSAHTGEEQKKWIKLIKESADIFKRNKTVGSNQLRPTTSPGRIEHKEPTPIFDSGILEQADETQEPCLEQPDKVIISSPVTSVAEPVLTPLERARRLDEAIKETLQEKRRLVAEVINEVEERERREQMPLSAETESLHDTLQEAMEECSSFISELCDRESGLMQENIQMPIPMDKLKEMANRMNQILTNLLAVVGSRDEERERLRQELKAAQDELNMLREIQRKVSSTSPPDVANLKRERPQSLVSDTSTISSEDGTTQQQETEGEIDSNEDVPMEMEDESTELIEPEVAIATEIPQCIDTSDLQEIDPSDEETIEDLEPPQIPESDLINDAEVLHIPNVVTESEFLSEEVQDLDSLNENNKQELDSIQEEGRDNDIDNCDIPKEFHDTDHKSLNDDVLTDVDNDTVSDSDQPSNEIKPEQSTEESDNDFEKIEKSEIPKSNDIENSTEDSQTLKSEENTQVEESSDLKEELIIQEQNDKSQETESESTLSKNESSNVTDLEKSEADRNENIEKNIDANISESNSVQPSQ